MRPRLSPILLAAVCIFRGSAGAVTPRWAYTNYPCRIQFACPDATDAYALLPFYRSDLGFEPDAFRIVGPPPAHAALPWREVSRSRDRTLVLVRLDPTNNRPAQLTAYAAPAGVKRQEEDAGLLPATPILASSFPLRGRGIPATLPRLLYLLQPAARPARSIPLRDFPPDLPHEKRPVILQFQTFAVCPDKGAAVFRISGQTAPAFLFLNGIPFTNNEAAVTGPDCVEVRILTAADNDPPALQLEWKTPGSDAFRPVPATAYAGSSLAKPRKVELINRTLQPLFEADRQPPYGFRDTAVSFYPLKVADRSDNWLPGAMTRSWTFSNGQTSVEPEPVVTFTNAGPHTVTLSLEDELGFSNSLTHVVAWDAAIPRLYPLAAVPYSMPAAWFRSDTIEPALLTQGNWPGSFDVRLTARLRRLDGSEETRSFPIPPTHSPLITRMAACPAGEFDTLAWSVSHLGVTLTNGVIAALHPPYSARPVRLACDRLADDAGRMVVYVTPHRPANPTGPPLLATNAPLILIDDCLTGRAAPDPSGTPDGFAALLGQSLGEPVRVQPLSDWRGETEAWKPLLKLVEAPALAGSQPARIFLSVGGQDCAAGIAPESFERQAAALTDLLTGAGHAVTWITPPPFPERPDKARLYAVAIRRVAESRNRPVADLYSLFAGTEPEGAPLFHELFPAFLSPQGRRLAAERIAEQMRIPPPGEEPVEP